MDAGLLRFEILKVLFVLSWTFIAQPTIFSVNSWSSMML